MFTSNAIADLHTVQALAYARKLNAAQCYRCIGAAIDAYQPDSLSNDRFWLGYLTPTRFARDLTFARYDLLLGGIGVNDRTAPQLTLIDQLSAALREYPADRVLGKALVAARLATLLYLEGEQHTAHQRVEDVITLAGQVRSARLADEIRVLLRHVSPTGRADEYTRDLRQRLSAVLTDMA